MLDTRPLRLQAFRHLAAAATINELGNWIGELALAILVFDRTHSPLVTAGLFLSLRFLPALLGPLLTTYAEALPTRRLLPTIYVLEAVIFGVFALIHHKPIPLVLALAGLDGVLAIAAGALTRGAAATSLIDKKLLREGNGLLNIGTMAASAVGPLVAGLVVAGWSARAALGLDAISFLIVAFTVLTARELRVESDTETGGTGRLRAGIHVIRHQRGLLELMIALGLTLGLGAMAVPIEVVFAKHTLGAGDSGYGFLLASWGVGQILGGAAFAGAPRARIRFVLTVAAALIAAGYGGMAISPTLLIACVCSCVGGMGNGCGGVAAVTAVQQSIPVTRQSSVMAVLSAVDGIVTALGFMAGGAITAITSPRIAYAASGAGVGLVLLVGLIVVIGGAARARRASPGIDMGIPAPSDSEEGVGRRAGAADQSALMTESQKAMTDEPAPIEVSRSGIVRNRVLLGVDVVVLTVAGLVAVLTASDGHWKLDQLAVILMMTVVSDLMAVTLTKSKVHVTAGFLGIMLAAVLLGGVPAALVGVLTILAGWVRWRYSLSALMHNIVAFVLFPLASGLLFYEVTKAAGINHDTTVYYLVVFGTFMVGLTINFLTISAYAYVLEPTAPHFKLRNLLPILAPELAAAVLTLIAVYLAKNVGTLGLVLFALVLVIFQYLVGELLTSQRRGEELRLLATTDELTGLSNRKSFEDMLNQEVAAARNAGFGFGVLLLDLDHFKDINDTLGHQYGDLLLLQLAPRLKEMVGEGGQVARFGGDEFAVMPSFRSGAMDDLERLASDLLACVQQPVTVGEVTLEMSCSIGVSRFPSDGDDGQTLLRRADIAMYVAKDRNDGFRLYDPQYDHHSTSRLGLLADFRTALGRDNEIVVHYHPIVDLANKEIYGAEGLVRWQHPEHGLLQPAAFLQMIEQTGMIGQLSTHVLDIAIADCARWHRAGHRLNVAVNLSARNLVDPELTEEVAQMLRRHSVPPSSLKLEITESMIVTDPERALMTLNGLNRLGVRIALDDFGTGHSSLANLRKLPVDELKIDRSFVTPMLRDSSDLAIVRSTIDLGHALGLQVTGEGVENADLLSKLDELGCDHAQGHGLSVPLPSDEFVAWTTSRGRELVSVL